MNARRVAVLALLMSIIPALNMCLPSRMYAASGPQWVEVRSPHFSVITDGGEKRGRDVALRFEQMRAIFGALFGKDRVSTPIPLQIIAFRNNKELRDYGMLWKGKAVQLAGFFAPGEDRQFIALDLSAEASWQTVFHEYAHQLLNGNFGKQQLWFDEGFAEYYSTLTVSGKQARIGDPPMGSVQMLRDGRIPVEQLFSVGHHDAMYNENGERRNRFYAESWLVVHYLFDLKKINEAGKYFVLVQQGVPVPDAIRQAFGMEPKQFDKALDSYFHSSKAIFYTMQVPPGLDSMNMTAAVLSEADSQAALADLHLHSPDYGDKALAEFQQVIKLDPNSATGHRGLGYSYLRQRNFDAAAEEFRKAAELNSNDAYVHYYSAMLRFREGGTARPELDDVKQHLEKAITLNPEFADAFNLLAWAQGIEGDEKAALGSMRRAVQLSPRNETYQHNLAQYLMADQQYDEAHAILQRLRTSDNPEVASSAVATLAQLERYRQVGTAGDVPALRVADRENQMTSDSEQEVKVEHAEVSVAEPPAAPQPADNSPIAFLKGTLVSVDCSAEPGAVVTVSTGKRVWKMHTADRHKLLLIGVDEFSCSWTNRKVAVNYRAISVGEGNIFSLELQ